MSLIVAKNVARSHAGRTVFEGIEFMVEPGERIGIVGPNGSGKTTLLRIIAGREVPDSGDVARRRDLKIGWLPQQTEFGDKRTAIEEVVAAREDLATLESQLRRLEEEMAVEADPDRLQRLVERHGEFQEQFEREGGYILRHRAEEVLAGLGVEEELFEREVTLLSGGEAGRVALAKVLITDPDLLILDEPTNHLDLAGCEWLESYLDRFRGAFIVVSHDRYLLERVTRRTVEVDFQTARSYPGRFSQYEKLKVADRAERLRQFAAQQSHIRKEKEFIRKHKGSQRTKEAKGRERRLENLDSLEAPERETGAPTFRLEPSRRLGQRVIELDNVSAGYDDQPLVTGVDLEIVPGERLGIVGPNGAGKTTLLKVLGGLLEPTAGRRILGDTVELGWFDQRQADLSPEKSPFTTIAGTDLSLTEGDVKGYLARFRLRGEMVDRRNDSLSGGERARLAIANLILERPNVALLDEPTNHLDIGSRAAVEDMIDAYGGTVICVSHDRYFLDRLCDRILWIEDGEARLSTGGYTTAREKRREHLASPPAIDGDTKTARKARQKAAEKAGRPKKKGRRPEVIEKDLMAHEEEKEEILARMGEPEIYTDAVEMKRLQTRLDELGGEIDELEAEWEAATE